MNTREMLARLIFLTLHKKNTEEALPTSSHTLFIYNPPVTGLNLLAYFARYYLDNLRKSVDVFAILFLCLCPSLSYFFKLHLSLTIIFHAVISFSFLFKLTLVLNCEIIPQDLRVTRIWHYLSTVQLVAPEMRGKRRKVYHIMNKWSIFKHI